jgi:hypothetical protein
MSMAVKVFHRPNPLLKDGSFLPVIQKQPCLRQEEILQYMAKNTALEVQDMRSTLEQFSEALGFFLAKGFRLETSLGNFGLVAQGTIQEDEASFRPDLPESGHSLGINYRPPRRLMSLLNQKAAVENIPYEGPKGPLIKGLENLTRLGAEDWRPGEVPKIQGLRLLIDLQYPAGDEGLFWISEKGAATKVPLLIQNQEKALIAQVPDLEPGRYTVEIRNRMRRKTLLSGKFRVPLTLLA